MTSRSDRSDRRETVGLVVIAVILFGWNVWAYDLWAPDEPYFGEGAREMIVDGEWLVPHVNGEVTTDKPPVFFWLIALCSLPFGGVSSLTARLPSILAALGTLLLTIRLARRGQGEAGPRLGLLAGAILITTHIFWDKARFAQIDASLCFLILAALSAFEAFRAGDLEGRRAGLLFWGTAAVAVLAKGPVGLLLPLGIALVTLAVDRELPRWRSFAPFTGPLLFVFVTGLWVTATILWAQDYSVGGALEEHFFGRAVHGMHHRQPPWYYLKVLPYALLPWSLLLPGALLLAWRRRRIAADRFLLVHALFIVIFFSISTEKRDLYILPAVPAFALMTARLVAAVDGWWSAGRETGITIPGRGWVVLPLGIVGGLFTAVAVALPFLAPRFGDELVAPAVVLAVVLGLGGLASLVAAIRRQVMPAVLRTFITMSATLLVAVTFIYPALDPVKSGRELAKVVKDTTAGFRATGQPVLALGLDNVPRAVNFYSNGVYLTELSDTDELLGVLTGSQTHFLLANKDELPPMPESLEQRMSVVYSTRLSRKDIVLLRFDAVGRGL